MDGLHICFSWTYEHRHLWAHLLVKDNFVILINIWQSKTGIQLNLFKIPLCFNSHYSLLQLPPAPCVIICLSYLLLPNVVCRACSVCINHFTVQLFSLGSCVAAILCVVRHTVRWLVECTCWASAMKKVKKKKKVHYVHSQCICIVLLW